MYQIKNEDLLKMIMNNSRKQIWAVDRDYLLVLANDLFIQRIQESFGIKLSIGDSLLDPSYSQVLVDFWLAKVNKSFAGETHSVETKTVWNGEPHYFENIISPIKDDTGEINAVICISQDITEQKKIVKSGIDSTDQYQHLFENMAQGAVYQDASGAIISANNAALRILGLTMDQITGRTSFDPRWKAIKEDGSDFPGDEHPSMLALKTGKPVENVLMGVFHPANNEYRWILISAIPYKTGKEKKMQVFTTFTDITQLRNTEKKLEEVTELKEQLKQSNEKFSKMFYNHNAIMLLINPLNGAIIDANPSAIAFYGYSKDVFCSKKIFEINCSPKKQIEKSLNNSQTGHLNYFIFPHKLASGEIRTVEVRSTLIDLIDQKLLFAIIFDVTEKMKSEEALHLERHRLANVLDSTKTGTWEWDIQTGKTIFNERWAQIVGYTLSELEPIDINTWVRLTHPDDLQKSNTLLEEHFAGKTDYYEIDCRMKHKDGHWIWVLDRGKVIEWDSSGKPLKMYGTHQDITFRKKAEADALRAKDVEQLEKSEAQLRMLAARLQEAVEEDRLMISRELHDNLGQSLTAMKLNLFQLRTKVAKRNMGSLDELISIVSDMIGQTRNISKKMRPPMLDELGLVMAIEWLVEDIRKMASFHIEFKTNVSFLKIEGHNSIELYRIIQESLTNVVRHAHAKNVLVDIHEADNELCVLVSDDGIGMKIEELNQIQTLGMLGMKERAKIIRGELKIESNKGAGTCIKLKIPNL